MLMPTDTARYAKVIENSKRMRFDIDRDVIRGRQFDFTKKFLPDGLSKVDRLVFLNAAEQRLLSQIQGRTYANIFGLVERFIAAKVLEVSREHSLGDQNAFEALVRFTDEEIKHQEMFRRIEEMVAAGMPRATPSCRTRTRSPRSCSASRPGRCSALTCYIELFVLAHYRESIDRDDNLSALWKDVFLHHWREESQHAILDELEWVREDAKLSPAERDQAVNELIELVAAVDGILQVQAAADADYFVQIAGRTFSFGEAAEIRAGVLAAYRWQYIVSGVQGRFSDVLGGMINAAPGRAHRRRPCAAHAIVGVRRRGPVARVAWWYWAATALALAAADGLARGRFRGRRSGRRPVRPFLRARRADRRASGAGADRVPRLPARRALAAARGDPLAAARRDDGEGGLRILPARADAGAHALEPDAAAHAAARPAGVSDAPGPGQHPRGPVAAGLTMVPFVNPVESRRTTAAARRSASCAPLMRRSCSSSCGRYRRSPAGAGSSARCASSRPRSSSG